jgi:hypothetical protein
LSLDAILDSSITVIRCYLRYFLFQIYLLLSLLGVIEDCNVVILFLTHSFIMIIIHYSYECFHQISSILLPILLLNLLLLIIFFIMLLYTLPLGEMLMFGGEFCDGEGTTVFNDLFRWNVEKGGGEWCVKKEQSKSCCDHI